MASVLGGVLGASPQLLCADGALAPAQEVLRGCAVVGLYFSASWCTPCRSFTPKLVALYENMKKKMPKGQRFEIILVPRDTSETAFEKYRASMPWPSLPLRENAQRLNHIYKVPSIPSLVLVEPNGVVIAANGRHLVLEDPEGADFPWRPQPLRELISTTTLQRADGTHVSHEVLSGKYIGLYFSASWCPPCRRFTPKLVQCFNNLRRMGKPFEIVLVSSDRSPDDYKRYLDNMPWLALPFAERRLKEKLSGLFDIQGIPSVVILSPDLEVVTLNGKSDIGEDVEGLRFPWKPLTLCTLTVSRAAQLNQAAHLVYFTDGTSECIKRAHEILQPLADHETDLAKAAGRPPLRFMIVGEDLETGDLVREFANLGEEEPLLALLDIPKQLKYIGADLVLTTDTVEKILDGWRAGRTAWQHLDR